MRIFSPAQTAQALPYDKLVPAVARAASERANGQIHSPERQVVAIDSASVLLSMPAIGSDIGVTKLITVHANNAAHRLPAIQGEVIVFDTATGRRLALLDGPTVTARRTAAMTLLGIHALAPRKPETVLLIGTGVQADAHADALAEFFGVAKFWIAGTDLTRATDFCRRLTARRPAVSATPLPATALQSALAGTDVLIALTTSRTPVIPADIPEDMFVVGVGAFKPDMAEFPPALLRRRPIVVDDLEGARHEAGDLLQAGIDWSSVCDIGKVLNGTAPLFENLPVFKTVGQASWDLAAARVTLESL